MNTINYLYRNSHELKKLKFTFILIITFSIILLIGCTEQKQSTKISPSENKNELHKRDKKFIADSLSHSARYKEANELYKTILEEYPQGTSFKDSIDLQNTIALNSRKLRNYDESISLCNSSIELAKSKKDSINLNIAQTYYILGLIYKDFQKSGEAINFLNKCLGIRIKILGNDDPLVGDVYNNLGVLSFFNHNYKKAEKYYKIALKLRKKRGLFDKTVGSTYMNLGNINDNLGNLDLGLHYLDTALTIQKKIYGESHPSVANILLNQGIILERMGLYDSSNVLAENAAVIYKEYLGESHPYLGYLYNNIGVNLIGLGDFEKARSYIQKSLLINKKNPRENINGLIDNYTNLASIESDLGNYQKSENYIDLAESILEENGIDNLKLKILVRKEYYLLYSRSGQYKKALSELKSIQKLYNKNKIEGIDNYKLKIKFANTFYYLGSYKKADQNAKQALYYFKTTDDIIWLRAAELLKENIDYKREKYFTIINDIDSLIDREKNKKQKDIRKIESYTYNLEKIYLGVEAANKLYNLTKEGEQLDRIIYYTKFALLYYSKKHSFLDGDISKAFESSKIKNVLKIGINANYEKFVSTKDSTNLINIINLMESAKSLNLQEQIQRTNNLSSLMIPDSVKNIRKTKLRYLTYLKRNLKSLDEEQSDEREKIYDKVFQLNRDIESIDANISAKYPRAREAGKVIHNLSFKKLDEDLLKNSTVLNYFVGEKYLYIVVLELEQKTVIKKAIDSNFNKQIDDFLKSISNNNFSDFKDLSYSMFKSVMPEKKLINTNRLIIIPDKRLGLIPFDALLQNDSKNINSYKDLPYLIKDFTISYGYALSILDNNSNLNEVVETVLGIAPFSN